MHVTLRKAAALQLSLQEVSRKIQLADTVEVSQFQDHRTVVPAATAELDRAVSHKLAVNAAIYEIRKLVGAANTRLGIDDLLADVARVTAEIAMYETLVAREVQEEDAVIQGKLDKIRSIPADSQRAIYGVPENVDVHVLTAERREQLRADLAHAKREKQRLQDRLLELNVANTIVLSTEVTEILESERLV